MAIWHREHSRIPDCEIRISRSKTKNGKYILYGKLYHTANNMRLGNRHEYRYDPGEVSDDDAVRSIIRRVEDAFQKDNFDQAARKPTAPAARGVFSRVFGELKRLGIKKSTWGEGTANGTYKYAQKNVLPKLDALGSNISDEDMEQLKKSLVEKAAKNRRGQRNLEVANHSVSSYLQRVNWLLEAAHQHDRNVPLVRFDLDGSLKVPTLEKAKAISDAVRVILACVLLGLAANGLSLGVAAMLLMGLRTAEACAIRFDTIMIRDEWFLVCPVLAQIKNGERVIILKTDAAYRCAIGGVLMTHLVSRRYEHLRTLGYSEEEVTQMPLVSDGDDPNKFANPSTLSAYAKELLLACGYEEECLRLAGVLAENDLTLDEKSRKELDVTAYILRRDYVTRAANCCGMAPADIDYLVGHENAENKNTDYTNPDIQRELAFQLERYVFLPEFTRHPYYAPILAKYRRRKTEDLEGFNGYRIIAEEEPLEIVFDMTTEESGETIVVTTDGKTVEPVARQYDHPDSPKKREDRPLVGALHPESYYQKRIEEAEHVDLRKFLPKILREKKGDE